MTLANNFEAYINEIELIQAQNPVECELYSIISCIIRERKNSADISVRDVSVRRKTKLSANYHSNAGFPDFVILTKEKTDAQVLGAIEIKRVVKSLDYPKYLGQLVEHVHKFGKVIYTNGLKWRYYDTNEFQGNNFLWEIELGEIKNKEIIWNKADKWRELLENLDGITWYKNSSPLNSNL